MPAPTKSLRVLIIANACPWVSWPEKIAAIKAFYAPLVNLEIDLKQADFENIPLGTYPGSTTIFNGAKTTDVPGVDIEINQQWFAEYIGPMFVGYDIVVFQTANVATGGLPLGIKFEKFNGTWCCETFVTDENYIYILPNPAGTGVGITLGNEAETIIKHEISHALYSITGQPDNTHLYFYANNFERVLTDIKLPDQVKINSLYQQVIALLEEELGIIKANQATADMKTPTSVSATTFPAKIIAWAKAIISEEGAKPGLHNGGNLKFTTLTASWGATKGPAASDGGFLAQFATDQMGEDALCNFLVLGCEDELIAFHSPEARTLGGFTKIYAGNPPQGYISAIEEAIGETGGVQISTFLS